MSEEGKLYDRMIKSIRSSHEWGDTISMFKLPLILTDIHLYGAAISQFYYLTKILEDRLNSEELQNDQMIKQILSLNLHHTSKGYESDLKQIYGKLDWIFYSDRAITSATKKYGDIIKEANSVQLVAITFILLGALVIGGGKATQRKLKKVFKSCDHKLFNITDNVAKMRRDFKECYNNIGKEYNESIQNELILEAKRFMQLNNTVLMSIKCVPSWCWKYAIGTVAAISGACVMKWMYF